MHDRTIRSLARIQGSASTARTLNLHAIWTRYGETEEYRAAPLFQSPLLNRSIVLKHRLRRNETDVFHSTRTSGTKVILPLDASNLRSGAQYFFVDQRGYGTAVRELLGDAEDHSRDLRLLGLLDGLPSLDPFLMREKLRAEGYLPATCYFHVSDADMRRMFAFVNHELKPLVGVSYDSDVDFVSRTAVLARKILSNDVDAEMEPLRQTLRLERPEFENGVFCWKGFLYYKWNLAETAPQLRAVLDEITDIKPRGRMGDDTRRALAESRQTIRASVNGALDTVRTTLQVYQDAFDKLARHGKPSAFREFLLDAPSLFAALGERLGAVNHIVSFWRFRFPKDRLTPISPAELLDIFVDFEAGLNFPEVRRRAA